jgi:hypothetical protein
MIYNWLYIIVFLMIIILYWRYIINYLFFLNKGSLLNKQAPKYVKCLIIADQVDA